MGYISAIYKIYLTGGFYEAIRYIKKRQPARSFSGAAVPMAQEFQSTGVPTWYTCF